MYKKKLWIFGDSYGAPHPEIDYAFTERLEMRYDVKNLAKNGTSVDWSLVQFLNTIDNNETKDTSVVFFHTSPYRQYWKFLDDNDHWLPSHLADGSWKKHESYEQFKKYENYEEFSKTWFYNLHFRYYEINLHKSLAFINMYAKLFEKVLILPCFDKIELNFELNKNVFFNKMPLSQTLSVPIDRYDPRPNHMTEEEHTEMYYKIVEWMDSSV